MGNKAIVKKTGETVNVLNEFRIMHMSFSFEFDLGDKVKDYLEETFVHPGNGESDREGNYYTCDNNETYHESEVIVGLDEIREYKIKRNLDL